MNPYPPFDTSVTALLEKLSGSTLGSKRLRQVVDAYAPILDEIARLREMDLHNVHPAVLFEPTAPYRRKR